MGMYTALSLGVRLKNDTPDEVTELLRYMVDSTADCNRVLPDHPLFGDTRWNFMLRCDSYYFDYQTGFTFERDGINGAFYLSGVSNLKNYGGEIKLFLDWIEPWIDTSGFIGWTQYEASEWPTILTMEWGEPDNKLHMQRRMVGDRT